MTFFKIFGLLQIIAVILYMIFGKAPSGDIPFMIVGCVILFLVYFKLTGFIAKQNQWKKLEVLINKKKEFVFDCELISTYVTSHGDKHSAKEYMANVRVDGKEIRCNTEPALLDKEAGTKAVLVCMYTNVEVGFKYLIGARV